MSNRTMANRPCNDDYEALIEVYKRLIRTFGEVPSLDSAVNFMLYAAISQLNKNFVVFTGDYQFVNDVFGSTVAKRADIVINLDDNWAASNGGE